MLEVEEKKLFARSFLLIFYLNNFIICFTDKQFLFFRSFSPLRPLAVDISSHDSSNALRWEKFHLSTTEAKHMIFIRFNLQKFN